MAQHTNRTKNPLYVTWNVMIQRCHNPKHHKFKHYGRRGITVCDSWRESFEAFLIDMGPRPSEEHSLDRIDNDGNYEPGNVRWATSTEQNRNRRNNIVITIDGATRVLQDWCAILDVPYPQVWHNLKKGYGPLAAIYFAPSRKPGRPKKTPATVPAWIVEAYGPGENKSTFDPTIRQHAFIL